MRTALLGLFSVGAFLGSLWLGSLMGNPDVSEAAVVVGRTLAAILGIFTAGAVHVVFRAR